MVDKKTLFRGKVDSDFEKEHSRLIEHLKEQEEIDKNGYVYGWYINGYIVGEIIRIREDSLTFDFVVLVDKNTVDIYPFTSRKKR